MQVVRYSVDELASLLVAVDIPEQAPKREAPDESPIERWNGEHDQEWMAEQLEAIGFIRCRSAGRGQIGLDWPGSSTPGVSCVVYDTHVSNFSETAGSAVPWLGVRKRLDAFDVLAHTQFKGDTDRALDHARTTYGMSKPGAVDEDWINSLPEKLGKAEEQIEAAVGALTRADWLRSKLLRGREIFDVDPKQPLIEGWLDIGDFAVMFGPPGSGKSFVAIDMAGHIATGQDWHGQPVKKGNVLYLVAEGAQGIPRRWQSWLTMARMPNGDVPQMTWLPVRVNLREPEWAKAAAEVATEVDPVLVVVDTLARTFAGGNENSSEDMGAYISGADLVREATAATVLIIHHSGKDVGAGSRGHSSLLGAVDAELQVRPSDDYFYLESTKQKDKVGEAALRFKLEQVDESAVAVLAPRHDRADSVEDIEGAAKTLRVLEERETPGGMTVAVWRDIVTDVTDVSRSSFYRHVSMLVKKGLILDIGTDSNPRYIPVKTRVEAEESLV